MAGGFPKVVLWTPKERSHLDHEWLCRLPLSRNPYHGAVDSGLLTPGLAEVISPLRATPPSARLAPPLAFPGP